MKQEDIIRMAREAGFADGIAEFIGLSAFDRFADLVASAERERLAGLIDQMPFGDTAASFSIWIREQP